MTFFRSLIVFILLWGSCADLSAQESLWKGYGRREESPLPVKDLEVSKTAPTEKRFYLLKTGYLLEGNAENDGTHYDVKTEFGGMRIPVSNVEHVASSREEVFRYKKDRTDPGNVSESTKLAEWCFANALTEEGIEEYERVLPLAPNPLMADFIRKRLDTVKDSAHDGFDAIGNPFPSPDPSSGAGGNDPELARWTREMPQSVVDAFSKKVQPILVGRCASVDCHGSNSDNQYKIRIPRQVGGTTTYRNMKATVEWVDLEHPTDSPVLSALVTPHGGVKAPFDVESKQYQRVVDWIQLTAKEIPIELNKQLADRFNDRRNDRDTAKTSPTESPNAILPPGFDDLIGAIPASFSSRSTEGPVASDAAAVSEYRPTSLIVPNATSPDDPFDPRPFNARYHPAIVGVDSPNYTGAR